MNKRDLENAVKKCVGFFGDSVDAVVLFGSRAKGSFSEESDFDVCIVGEFSLEEREKIYSFFPEECDLSFFYELPIWIRIRVFGEGQFLFVKDLEKIYSLHSRVLKDYEDFRVLLGRRILRRFGKCLI
jgi:predicted nucleotidyltransferase